MTAREQDAVVTRAFEGGAFDDESALHDEWIEPEHVYDAQGRQIPSVEQFALAVDLVLRAEEILLDHRLTNRWTGFDAIMDWSFRKRYPGVESRWVAVRRIDAEESAILVNAVVGGGLDEPMLDFFRAPLGTKEETVAERAVDERFSRLLGRKVYVWVKNGDELTPEEDRVWHALFNRNNALGEDC